MNLDNFFVAPSQTKRFQSAYSDFNAFLNKKLNSGSSTQSQSTTPSALNLSEKMNGKQVFAKSIEFSMGIKVESAYEFKVPSPQDVANTVLGFVEKRIGLEKNAGASTERLNNLMEQARAGVKQGYAQAEKDIKGLGLMTEDLKKEIDAGFQLIGKGLDGLQQEIDPSVKVSILNLKEQQATEESQNTASLDGQNQLAEKLSGVVSSESEDLGLSSNPVGLYKYQSLKQLTENTADFVLKTQEGDKVFFSLEDMQKVALEVQNGSTKIGLQESSRYTFSVEGDLNQAELSAINDLLDQVSNLSSLFFSEQFDAAFSAALNLGFDGSQIAAFSLDLKQLQVQEVKVYEQGSKQTFDAIKRNQPLITVAKEFEQLGLLLDSLDRFEERKVFIQDIFAKEIERLDKFIDEQAENAGTKKFALADYVNSLLETF